MHMLGDERMWFVATMCAPPKLLRVCLCTENLCNQPIAVRHHVAGLRVALQPSAGELAWDKHHADGCSYRNPTEPHGAWALEAECTSFQSTGHTYTSHAHSLHLFLPWPTARHYPPPHTHQQIPKPNFLPLQTPPPTHTPAGGILRGLSAPAATRSRRSLSAMAVAAPVSAAAKQAEFVKQAHGFSLVQQQFVREYDSHVLMYKHDKTGGWVGG